MEPALRGHQHRQQHAAACWSCVRKWNLPPQAKLAWYFLFERAGNKIGQVCVHTGEVGLDQGLAYPEKAGRTALKNLWDAKLIRVFERRRGQWTIHLVDPVDLHNTTVRVAEFNPQPDLDYGDVEQPNEETERAHLEQNAPFPFAIDIVVAGLTSTPAEVGERAQLDETAPFPSNNQEENTTHHLCARDISQSEEKSKGANGPSCALSPLKPRLPTLAEQAAKAAAQRAREDSEPPSIGMAITELCRSRQESFEDAVSRFQTKIRVCVAAGSLFPGFVAKVARVAAGDDAVASALEKLLDYVRVKFGVGPDKAEDRRRYFCRSAGRLLKGAS